MSKLNVVTGAHGFTGRAITGMLLTQGESVRTLTGHPDRPGPFRDQVPTHPFNFDRPDELARSLEGAACLYNTYWVRFPHDGMTFDRAVQNSRILFDAARRAGVERIVHLSVTQADERSPLAYFRGKAQVERAARECGLSYAIVRPTMIYGEGDILLNNIAWFLRRLPAFAVPGSGRYRVQPVSVEDVASMCVEAGAGHENLAFDAAGPNTFTFDELVRMLARATGARARLVHLPAPAVHTLLRFLNPVVRDVVLTREEIEGLMADLLISEEPARGHTRLSTWIPKHADSLGRRYASELERHFRGASNGRGPA